MHIYVVPRAVDILLNYAPQKVCVQKYCSLIHIYVVPRAVDILLNYAPQKMCV